MKIEKFLNWIHDKMLNYPDISYRTIKIFIDKFYCCLSKREKERWLISIQLIKEYSLKQITLDTFVRTLKSDKFTNDLERLKEANKSTNDLKD